MDATCEQSISDTSSQIHGQFGGTHLVINTCGILHNNEDTTGD